MKIRWKKSLWVVVTSFLILNFVGFPLYTYYSQLQTSAHLIDSNKSTRDMVPEDSKAASKAKQNSKPDITQNSNSKTIKKNKKDGSLKKSLEKEEKEVSDQEAIAGYLDNHHRRCEAKWRGKTLPPGSKPLCDCVPSSLLGFQNVSTEVAPLNDTLTHNPDVDHGGHWEPKMCTARYKVVIIVPYRDREYHLSVLLKYLHPKLRGQQLNYTIVVVEQNKPKVFNKAALMNIGYFYAKEVHQPDCVIFHDVDIIPEDGRHFYTCRKNPLHLGAFHTRHKYRLIYAKMFGAVTSFRLETFEKINGFSNRFFGWGGEDDEMSNRLQDFNQTIDRDPRPVAGYTALVHDRDKGNIQVNRDRAWFKAYTDRDARHDGLNSLRFVFEKRRLKPLYTWLLVNVMNDETKTDFL